MGLSFEERFGNVAKRLNSVSTLNHELWLKGFLRHWEDVVFVNTIHPNRAQRTVKLSPSGRPRLWRTELWFTRAGLAREQFSPMPIPASALRKIIPCSVPDPWHVECKQGKQAAVNCYSV